MQIVAGDGQAPTTVRDRDGIIRDHLADSLAALELAPVRRARSIADLGAGAGFPGLPLAIALPAASVALVESNGRKCEFIERAIGACGLRNARAVQSRAEAWTDGLGCCDLVTARAVDSLAVMAEYAAPLLRIGGTLVAWRGRRDVAEEKAASRAAEVLGLAPGVVIRTQPYPGAQHRHLHSFTKTAPTPDRFPRRPGMAHKRPLGAASDRPRR